MILTNTYQTSVEGYMEHLELTEEASVELIKNTVRLAHVAKDKYLRELKELNNKSQTSRKFTKIPDLVKLKTKINKNI